jgi:hypothetical protein
MWPQDAVQTLIGWDFPALSSNDFDVAAADLSSRCPASHDLAATDADNAHVARGHNHLETR